MITAIYSLSHIHGAEIWLLFWCICTLFYLAMCFLIKTNRTENGRKKVWLGLLLAELLVDAFWAILYYHNGAYINYGVGAVYGLFTYIPVLILTFAVVTIRNKR